MSEGPASRGRTEWGKLLLIGFMFMAQTFPSGFVSSFIPSIFRKQGVHLQDFWIFSLPLIPYWLRWLIAPVIDTFWNQRVGRRKSWMIPCTILAVAVYASLALVEPTRATLNLIIAILFAKSVFTATQEVAIDAYVVDNVKPSERSKVAGLRATFEAVGQMLALALLGQILQRFGWAPAAVVAALLMLVFLTPAFIRREPPTPERIIAAIRARPAGLAGLFAPLARYLKRPDTRILIPIYIVSGLYTGALFPMLGPFLIDAKYSIATLGLIVGVTLALATLCGSITAATLVGRVGARPILMVLAILSIPASLPAVCMAINKVQLAPLLTIAILIMPTLITAIFYVVLVTLRMGFASPLQAGTDYATGAAITRIGQTLAAALGGPIAALVGWQGFYLTLAVFGSGVMLVIYMTLDPLQALIRQRDLREAPVSVQLA